MKRFDGEKWYTTSAAAASPELGAKGLDMIRDHLRRVLRPAT
jgi:hypothetical protein